MLHFSHEILHGTSSGFSGLHFGLAEQLTARRDPHRLTYLQLESRVRRADLAGHGKRNGGGPTYPQIWYDLINICQNDHGSLFP